MSATEINAELDRIQHLVGEARSLIGAMNATELHVERDRVRRLIGLIDTLIKGSVTMPIIVEDLGKSAVQLIRDEAERRIRAGITVDGEPFRADDASTQRVGEMVAAFAANLVPPEGVTFRTAAGATLTLTTRAEAEAIRDALLRHRAAVLAVSAEKQDGADVDWPTPEAVTL